MVAAHPRNTLVSETRVLWGWAATLPRAPALGFFGKAGSGVFVYAGSGVFDFNFNLSPLGKHSFVIYEQDAPRAAHP